MISTNGRTTTPEKKVRRTKGVQSVERALSILDAFIGNINDQPNTVWLNDGLGNFSDTGQRLGGSYSAEVVLGDVDSDGDLDAFVANFWSQPKSMAAETMVSW